MAHMLPAASYNAPPRQARGRQLNTIIEDHEATSFGSTSGSGTDTDEGTVIGRPAGLDAKFFVAAPKRSQLANTYTSASPQSASSSASGEIGKAIDFDDLYDVSDDETQFSESCPSLRDSISSNPTSFATDSNRNSAASAGSGRNRYPSITIPPSSVWPSLVSPFKSPYKASPVPPTPPPKILLSPALLSRIGKWVPTANAPPSLGSASSVTSDQIPAVSAPCTPEIHSIVEGESWGGNQEVRVRREPDSARDVDSDTMSPQEEILIESEGENWSQIMCHFPRIPGATPQDHSPMTPNIDDLPLPPRAPPSIESSDPGVRLPPEAMRTLKHLLGDKSPDLRSNASTAEQIEMKERSNPPSRPRSVGDATPLSENSGYSFSKLSIPSPGGFFSSLRAGARHTWSQGQPDLAVLPSSTTAAEFYREQVPWEESERTVEQILEVEENMTDGPPTARQAAFNIPEAARKQDESDSPLSAMPSPVVAPEIRYEYDEAYDDGVAEAAGANLDRTSVWLAAQSSYMSALRETNPINDVAKDWTTDKRLSSQSKDNGLDSSIKKAVRFMEEAIITTDEPIKEGEEEKEPIFHQAFRHMLHQRKRRDAFVHATARIDAVQSLRVALKDMHIDQLLGKYEIKQPQRPKYSGPFSQNPRQTGIFDLTPAQIAFRKVEAEKAALDQIQTPFWIIDALKTLNGNQLLASPVTQRLDRAALPLTDPKCIGSQRRRVLDLGGHTAGDWSWHVAHQYSNVKVYTVITKSQTSTSKLAGPPNHRQVSVPHIWQLPFRDAHFDLISARSLHAMLKHEPVPGETAIDEYDLCLKECMRVLKPGGYLEFMVLDASIAHAGPLGSKMSVEFGFNLKTRGYDAMASSCFIKRLRKNGYTGTKRAWMFMPMGAKAQQDEGALMGDKKRFRETPTPRVRSFVDGSYEAVQGPVGETSQAANITGLLGGWMWEQWMLKLQMEMGKPRERLLEGVVEVMEEGRECGAGWRCLSGWARRPKGDAAKKGGKGSRERGTIRIKIEEESVVSGG